MSLFCGRKALDRMKGAVSSDYKITGTFAKRNSLLVTMECEIMSLIINTLFDEFCVVFMRYKGKITDWNNEKGFGFISPEYGGKNVFVHIS